MPAIEPDEITPGLVTYLDTSVLEAWPGIETNVRELESGTRLANDNRPFLILQREADGTCFCTPLLSNGGADRIALDQSLKDGPGKGWLGRVSYFSRFQFWKIPPEAIVSASSGEVNPIGNRKRYASGQPSALQAIISHQSDSDAPYRTISN